MMILELSPEHEALIDRLQETCNLKTSKDVIENALILFGWAVNEATNGLAIAAIDEEQKVYRELQIPALRNIKKTD